MLSGVAGGAIADGDGAFVAAPKRCALRGSVSDGVNGDGGDCARACCSVANAAVNAVSTTAEYR